MLLDKSDGIDDRFSSYQTFESHPDTKRLEYTTNESQDKLEEEKQYFDSNYNTFDFKSIGPENEELNVNEFSRRKSINSNEQSKTSTTSNPSNPSTPAVQQIDYNKDVKTIANDDLNDRRAEESLDSNKLFKEDLQNPDFEEAIASYMDENGGIHLHDGPGGLYGLVPPHTVSDHHIDVFSRPAIQDNRVSGSEKVAQTVNRQPCCLFYIKFFFASMCFVNVKSRYLAND